MTSIPFITLLFISTRRDIPLCYCSVRTGSGSVCPTNCLPEKQNTGFPRLSLTHGPAVTRAPRRWQTRLEHDLHPPPCSSPGHTGPTAGKPCGACLEKEVGTALAKLVLSESSVAGCPGGAMRAVGGQTETMMCWQGPRHRRPPSAGSG